MSGPHFFQTQMGRTFFEGTVPRLVKQLERIATALERLADGVGKPASPSLDTAATAAPAPSFACEACGGRRVVRCPRADVRLGREEECPECEGREAHREWPCDDCAPAEGTR